MENLSRTLVVVMTVIAGVAAAVSFFISLHTLAHTPSIQDVPIYVRGQLHRMEDKNVHLLTLVVFQFVCFIAMAAPALSWEKYKSSLEQKAASFRTQFAWARGANVSTVILGAFGVFLLFELALFMTNLNRCLSLVSGVVSVRS